MSSGEKRKGRADGGLRLRLQLKSAVEEIATLPSNSQAFASPQDCSSAGLGLASELLYNSLDQYNSFRAVRA